ncbi:BRCA1-associated ATM activator 1 [Engraulis encrasicolus]|uniref:BRCA1-associated ATM activator 1 n=1 Tax=Engraulis encrasicolus TaxID=184585 RepID=UPI002FD2D0D7
MSQATMDNDCIALLPGVLAFLADPKQSLPDDTCLEKLLDWLTSIVKEDEERNLLDQQPYLLEFLGSMFESKTTDPIILSFSLKLTGLLAATERGFSRLDERGIVRGAFACEDASAGAVKVQWEEASVRCGWLLGLRGMLTHQSAMGFISQTGGLTKLILKLQCDRSLFVAAAANQLLAHILNFPHQPITEQIAKENMHSQPTRNQAAKENGDHSQPIIEQSAEGNGDNHRPIAGKTDKAANGHQVPECSYVTVEIVGHVEEALVSHEHFRVLQALRLLALSLPGCGAPLLGKVWRAALHPLESLVEAGGTNKISLPVMDVLQAASTTELFGQSEARVEELMRATLRVDDPKIAIQCASAITRLQNGSESLRRMAVGIVLQPLEFITGSPLQSQHLGSGDAELFSQRQPVLGEQMSQRSMCISLLSLSLSSVAELSLSNSLFVDAPSQSVTGAVLQLLRVCLGQSPAHLPYNKSFLHLIGCSRVQRCGLDALTSLSSCDGSQVLRKEVLDVLLQYLEHPDTEPTVLQKALQALLKWICVPSPEPSDQTHFHAHNLFPALMKRVCDVHWEVRDSTLEFITQLTVNSKDSAALSSALWGSGIVSLLLACLDDSEGYVRASAVSALGQAVTAAHHQGELNANSPNTLTGDVLTRLVGILSDDTEGFPRRAVIKAFIGWQSAKPRPLACLQHSLPGVLALGIDDFDWEVKVHTLELVEMVMDQTLTPMKTTTTAAAGSLTTSSGAVDQKLTTISTTTGSPSSLAGAVDQTPSPTTTTSTSTTTGSPSSLAGALEKLHEHGTFCVLFKGLLDCDRPVAQRACQLLLKLREVMEVTEGHGDETKDERSKSRSEGSTTGDSSPSFHLQSQHWGADLLRKCTKEVAGGVRESDLPGEGKVAADWARGEVSLREVMIRLDLEGMREALMQSSDHVMASPQSLMEDILAAARQGEDNAVDCY